MSGYSTSSPHIRVDDNGTITAVKNRFSKDAAALRWMSETSIWADAIGPTILASLKRHAPVKTGKLRDSLMLHRRTFGGMVRIEITAGVKYYPFVVKGTGPHEIYAKHARALAWHDKSGVKHFARMVHHPGTKANNFPKKTMDEMRAVIITTYLASLRKAYIS